ncbi:MAG: GNAT family N-acetyltransferase [Mycobacteriales bacterium]
MSYTLRRPTLADAPALRALMCACDVATMDRPDTTLADVVEELRDPDLSLDDDAWIAVDPRGDAVGCAFVFGQEQGDIVELDVYVHPAADESLDAELWDAVEARSLAIGRALGHAELRLDVGVHRSDERARRVVTARGFVPATVYFRMRSDHSSEVLPRPELPPGVAIEIAGADERLCRASVDVHNASFAEHFGHVERSYEYRVAKFEATTTTGWDLVRVALVDGVPAGLLVATTQFVEDENCGYVGTLGVGKEFRGRGLGRLLLLDAFARDTEDGRVGTILHVDANNVTPALGLYESVGMRQVMVIDNWRQTVQL